MRPLRPLVLSTLAVAGLVHAANAANCSARGSATPVTVVELYTSEGCNSCPPADAWLSSLRKRPDVLPLGFHVDYWDRLGWKDRFASPAFTQRQQQVNAGSGSRFIYTPQVLVNGRDWRGWPGALPAATPAVVNIELQREAGHVQALVHPRAGAPARLAGYWVTVEDGHVSAVKSGENAGVTLHHDAVVREYRPISPWGNGEAQRLDFTLPAGNRPTSVALVITDAATRRPLGALKLDC